MSGVVTDKQSHTPIEGATVAIVGNKANQEATDAEGSFILSFAEGVREGEAVRIHVEKLGYRPYDKLVAVSSTIPLQVSLLAIKAVPPLARASRPPIAKADSFSTLVPFHAEWKNAPIPMNLNFSDPRQEFYGALVELADRPNSPPQGWPPYKERNFESLGEQFNFVTRLIQFYVFRSIYFMERGVAGGIKWTAGVGVTPINKKPIMPPDAVPYPTKEILDALSGNEFLNPMDEMLWNGKPLTVPAGTHLTFTEHANPEKGEVFTCIVGLEKPDYFKVDFEIQSGLGMNNQLPAGFSTQVVQGTTTYTVNIAMKYAIQKRKDHGFQPDQYATWMDSLFDGLKRQMAFETDPQASQSTAAPQPSGPLPPKVEVNAPNGIAIGGGIVTNPTVNNYSPLSRRLTADQKNNLKAAVSATKARIIIWFFNGNDTQRLAQDLYDVFQEAGWEMATPHPEGAIQVDPQKCDIGLFLPASSANEPASAAAIAVVTAMKSPWMHLLVGTGLSDNVPEGSVKLVVGPRWDE